LVWSKQKAGHHFGEALHLHYGEMYFFPESTGLDTRLSKGTFRLKTLGVINSLSPYSPAGKVDTNANTRTDSFTAGALSGMVAAFLTTPFGVGKTRIEVMPHAFPPAAGEPAAVRAEYGGGAGHVYKSMPSLLHGIWKDEGVRGLWLYAQDVEGVRLW